jgi:hypothetical protein
MRVIALIIIMLTSACDQANTGLPAQSYIDSTRLSQLQSEATKACICKRKTNNDTCWNNFRQEAAKYYNRGEWGTACGPASTSGISFDSAAPAGAGGNMTVLTDFGYGACSEGEYPAKKAEYEKMTNEVGC